MKKLKIGIIVIIFLIILLICILLVILNKYSKELDTDNDIAPIVYTNYDFIDIKTVNNKANIELYINRLLEYIKKQDKVAVYNILYREYIDKYNITQDNVLDKIYKVFDEYLLELSEVLVSQSTENFIYIIKGNVQNAVNIGNATNQEIYMLLINDSRAFKLMPISEETYIKMKNNQMDITKYRNDTISLTNYNNANTTYINDKKTMETYIKNYKFNLLYNPEKAYNLLEENYRNSKYGSLEKFKTEILNNIENIKKLVVEEVETEYIDNIKMYYGKMGNKTYVIKEISIYEYIISEK